MRYTISTFGHPLLTFRQKKRFRVNDNCSARFVNTDVVISEPGTGLKKDNAMHRNVATLTLNEWMTESEDSTFILCRFVRDW